MEDVDDGRGFERCTADGRSVLKARMMKEPSRSDNLHDDEVEVD